LIKAFPSISLFCEKPVTTGPIERIAEAQSVRDSLGKHAGKGVVGVGYMLRYLKACADIK
jgi:hypothetical protein